MANRYTYQLKPSPRGRSNEDDDGSQCCTSDTSNYSKLGRLSLKQQTFALEGYLDKLFEKKGSTRENALSSIVDSLTNNVQHRFVNNKCITLLHRCLNSIKQGSSRERYLAAHVIGLLSITVGCMDDLAHEILEDSVSSFSQNLQSASEPLKIAPLLDCLAIVTFVGGTNVEEMERSMQIMWQFIQPKPDRHVVANGCTTQLLTAAISAWSFLLATVDSWSISSKLWRESMSYFSNLLDSDDLSLRMAVGEALALIFEIGNLAKFFNESKSSSEDSAEENEGHNSIEGLKDTIINQMRTLLTETGDIDSTEKGLIKDHQTLFHDVLNVLKGCYSKETKIKIGGSMLKTSTWSQVVQVNYVKRFLGVGFVKHAQENKLFHDFFDFTPKRNRQIGGKQDISSDEKVSVHYVYLPEPNEGDGITQKKLNSSTSVINKAKTQLMNKKRMASQARNDGYYAVGFGDEDA